AHRHRDRAARSARGLPEAPRPHVRAVPRAAPRALTQRREDLPDLPAERTSRATGEVVGCPPRQLRVRLAVPRSALPGHDAAPGRPIARPPQLAPGHPLSAYLAALSLALAFLAPAARAWEYPLLPHVKALAIWPTNPNDAGPTAAEFRSECSPPARTRCPFAP